MVCTNCKKENKNSNIKCDFCGIQLIDVDNYSSDDKIVKLQEYLNNVSKTQDEIDKTMISKNKKGCFDVVFKIMFLILFVFVFFSIIVSPIVAYIYENYLITKNYANTTAIFIGCASYRQDACVAVYEYYVDDVKYTVTPSLIVEKDKYKENEMVYYDPENPKNSIIRSNWIGGIFNVLLALIPFVCFALFLRWRFKKKIKYDME